MTELSPASQAAWVAYLDQSEIDETPVDLPALAAALEAVADQVVPEHKPWHRTGERGTARHDVRLEFLAIAAELRGTTTNQEDNLSHA